jgi:aminoglycoside phosphotransferase (APT) family kinase protein
MGIRPDLQVSREAAQSIVDQVIPGQTVATVCNIHGGEIAAVYEIAFVGGHPPLILKIYPDALHWKMQKEVVVTGLIQDRLSVPAPRVLLADDSRKLLALNFIIMTRLNGASLGLLEQDLPPEQRLSAYVQIGQLLREFHRIPMEAFGYIGSTGILTPHSTNHAYLTHQFRRKLDEFVERGGDSSLARKVAGYFADRTHLLHACTQAVLCHNDLHAGNLLATLTPAGVQLTGVLDFEGALAGDPLMDVAKALYYLDDTKRRALLQGYGDMNREHWRETLELYHLNFVLELWCWMAQIGNEQSLGRLASDLAHYSAA